MLCFLTIDKTLIAVISDVEETFFVVGLDWSHMWLWLYLEATTLSCFGATFCVTELLLTQHESSSYMLHVLRLHHYSLASNCHLKTVFLQDFSLSSVTESHTAPRERERENKQRFIHPLLPNQDQSSHTGQQVSAWQAGCEGVETARNVTQTLGYYETI